MPTTRPDRLLRNIVANRILLLVHATITSSVLVHTRSLVLVSFLILALAQITVPLRQAAIRHEVIDLLERNLILVLDHVAVPVLLEIVIWAEVVVASIWFLTKLELILRLLSESVARVLGLHRREMLRIAMLHLVSALSL